MEIIEYDPHRQRQIRGIPKGFEGQLEDIIRENYTKGSFSLVDVQGHIFQNHSCIIGKRPLTYFITKRGLQKTHSGPSQKSSLYDETSEDTLTVDEDVFSGVDQENVYANIIDIHQQTFAAERQAKPPIEGVPATPNTLPPPRIDLHLAASLSIDERVPRYALFEVINGCEMETSLHHQRVFSILTYILNDPRGLPILYDISQFEAEAVQKLSIVLLCCGWRHKAERCFCALIFLADSLTNYSDDDASICDYFLSLTELLIWVIPLRSSIVQVELAITRWTNLLVFRYRIANRTTAKTAYSYNEIFAFGSLALTAKVYGLSNFHQEVISFWSSPELRKSVEWEQREHKRMHNYLKEFSLRYITSNLSVYTLRSTFNVYSSCPGDQYWTIVSKTLHWILQQLRKHPDPFKHYGSLHEWLRRATFYASIPFLDQQLLIAYLSSRHFDVDTSQAFLEDELRSPVLPWNLYREWLSQKVPMLTIMSLAMMVEPTRYSDADPWSNSVEWRQSMLSGIQQLLDDVENTVQVFHVIIHSDLIETFQTKFLVSNLATTKRGDQVAGFYMLESEVALNLILNTALLQTDFSTSIRYPMLGQPTYNDPMLLATPRSSMSGLRSLKSIYIRTRNRLSRDSLSSWSSYCHRVSRGTSSMHSVLGSLMRSSFNPNQELHNSLLRAAHDDKAAAINERSDDDGLAMEMDLS